MTKFKTIALKSRRAEGASAAPALGISALLAGAVLAENAARLTLCGSTNTTCDFCSDHA